MCLCTALKCQTIKMWLTCRLVGQKCCISCSDIIAIFTQNYIFRGSEVTGRTDKQFLGRLSHETGKKNQIKEPEAVFAYPVISVHVALVGCVHLWDQHPKTGSPRLSNPDVCFCGSAGSAESRWSWWARPLVSECLPSLLHWEEPWVALQAQYSSAPPLDQCQATQLNC